MKICIVTAVYGRHDLTKIVLDYYAQMQLTDGVVIPIAVGSEGKESERLCVGSGWGYIEYPNQPLSQKFNALFEATKAHDPDLVILTGSDDLISPKIVQYYINNVKPSHANLVGLKDLYFYSISKDQTLYFGGYNSLGYKNSPKSIGAGRCFTREVLERMKFRPWQAERVNRGLDSSSTKQMKRFGIGEEIVTMEQTGGCAVDIKHPHVSLTNWKFIHSEDRIKPNDVLEKHFSEQIKACRDLRKNLIFVPDQLYDVQITDRRHPLFGKVLHVNGTTAINWQERGIIDRP